MAWERDRAIFAEVKAVQAAQLADTESAIAVAVTEFFRVDYLSQADPENNPDRDVN